MAEIDPQLVEQITRQVLEALQRRSTAPHTTPPTERAAVHPPAGTCTGDYSKFVELRQREAAPGPAAPPASARPPAPAHAQPAPAGPPPLTGIVTAERLREAVARDPDGVARLAPDARLTPLANDFARENPDKISRNAASPIGNRQPAIGSAPWLWWADVHCPAVQNLTHALRSRLRPSAAPRSQSGLTQLLRDLARDVSRGTVRGGLLFVRHAGEAVCLANHVKGLRAVVGTTGDAVGAASGLGVNVVVIEHPHLSPPAMREVVERAMALPERPAPQIVRALQELSEANRSG